MLPPVPNPEFVSFVKIVIQLSPSLKPKVFAVHTSNFRNLQNNYLTLLYPNFVLIEVKLWSVFMIWWDLFFLGHPVYQGVPWCSAQHLGLSLQRSGFFSFFSLFSMCQEGYKYQAIELSRKKMEELLTSQRSYCARCARQRWPTSQY